MSRVAVIIPVLNEADSLPLVLAELPRALVDRVIVVDNGSTDASAAVARAHGAEVVCEVRRGYGSACLAGIAALRPDDEFVVFLDGDYSDYPEDLNRLLLPVREGVADLVIGTRMHRAARRALLPQARWGNQLATFLMRLLFGIRCTDLGPFRVIRQDGLRRLGMTDRDFGWTVEMQLRAGLRGLRVREVPVRYRRRVGKSKITGTVSGTLRAGYKILKTIVLYRLRLRRIAGPP